MNSFHQPCRGSDCSWLPRPKPRNKACTYGLCVRCCVSRNLQSRVPEGTRPCTQSYHINAYRETKEALTLREDTDPNCGPAKPQKGTKPSTAQTGDSKAKGGEGTSNQKQPIPNQQQKPATKGDTPMYVPSISDNLKQLLSDHTQIYDLRYTKPATEP